MGEGAAANPTETVDSKSDGHLRFSSAMQLRTVYVGMPHPESKKHDISQHVSAKGRKSEHVRANVSGWFAVTGDPCFGIGKNDADGRCCGAAGQVPVGDSVPGRGGAEDR